MTIAAARENNTSPALSPWAFRICVHLCHLWIFLLFPPAAAAEQKLKVLTTFLPAYCIAANIAGETAEVQNLVPGSTSPHDYQLTPSDMRRIQGADLIVLNGLGLESWLSKAFAAGNRPARKLVELAAGLRSELIHTEDGHDHDHALDGHDHAHGDINPHIWLDPRLAMQGVSNVLAAFKAADPTNAQVYTANANAYLARLRALDKDLGEQLAPLQGKPFVTQHNAFPYFARRYQLEIVGVVQSIADVSPSPREVARLSREMRAKKVTAIFTEPQGGGRLAKRLADDLKLAVGQLDTLEAGSITADAYEVGMRKNAGTLIKTLGQHGK